MRQESNPCIHANTFPPYFVFADFKHIPFRFS